MIWNRRIRPKVEFDEIFMDSSNLPSFNRGRMEGHIELPIARRNIFVVGILFCLITTVFGMKLIQLQLVHGSSYRERSEANSIDEGVIIAERGVVKDRYDELIAWNEHDYSGAYDFPVRAYTDRRGLGQLVGYVSYPQKDKQGFYFRTDYFGHTGIEKAYETTLHGENGHSIIEEDAHGAVISAHAVRQPISGNELKLSLDAELSEVMHDIVASSTEKAGFRSGAGAIMDVTTGEIIALTSFPSYDPEVMSDGDDVALIESYNTDERFPFLNKVIGGAYTPGSIVKPFLAYAALAEHLISPEKVIVSTGALMLPNPYDPSNPTRFADWRAHGAMTMREAIAFSSNVYFYIIGGGFGDQPGLGITRINEYMRLFGFGRETGIKLGTEQAGVVPNPEWKEEVFDEEWLLGDTYHTSIGQFGFQVTPLQMVAAYGAIANGGRLFVPHIEYGVTGSSTDLELDPSLLRVIHEGMRKTVNYPGGTARALERDDVAIAAKSGTAEIGVGNAYVNSWAAGFFPYEEPKYSFILLMDKAPRSNALGATRIMSEVVEWMSLHRPEYLGITSTNYTEE